MRIAAATALLLLAGLAPAAPATFDLLDANGVRVRSEDYRGTPLFLVFGACW
jgi:cytochrome oxidase Cu insertion factor (SCO1/SenC/PrrC family)